MGKKIEILLADDEDTFRNIMSKELSRMGYTVTCVENGEKAVSAARENDFDVAILDIAMPVLNGEAVLKKIKEMDSTTEVLMLTGEGSIESAVESMKSGAYDYITKPCKLCELDLLLKKAYEKRLLSKENTNLKFMVEKLSPHTSFLGASRPMEDVFKLIEKVAQRDCHVLIQGESGTGKELVAKSIHEKSDRSVKPFVVINCAALPETLLESELFGHTKGSFTGANQARAGLFEVADESTLFLDEIGELPLNIQVKLLRVLQSGEIRRVGSNKNIFVNARIIAATNKNLTQEVANGNFREDLFFRINVVEIYVPPLRNRKDDIPALIDHFLTKNSYKGVTKKIDPKAVDVLMKHDWPGNVREL
ncbi:MAG: sigma-54-dependent transcriptional regulator, partial [Candidatus Anammoxibacter sp.]